MSDEDLFAVYLRSDGLPTVQFEDATVAEVTELVRDWASSGQRTVLVGKRGGALVVDFGSTSVVHVGTDRPSYKEDPFVALLPQVEAVEEPSVQVF